MEIKAIADRLKYYRKVNELELADVAFLLGISEQDYQMMEKGAEEMPLKSMIKLARFYKITPEILLAGEEDVPAPEDNPVLDRIYKQLEELGALDSRELYEQDGLLKPGKPLSNRQVMDVLKKNGEEASPEQADKVLEFIRKMGQLAWDELKEQYRRKARLKTEPEGFAFEEKGIPCEICGFDAREGWYDQYGLRCAACQQAVLRGIIPATLCGHPELFYTEEDLDREFELRGTILSRWIRSGILKARAIPDDSKKIAYRLFLMEDNEGFLPPKAMLECDEYGIEEQDGEVFNVRLRWFQVQEDPGAYIAGYGIADYLSFTAPGDVDAMSSD